MIFLRMRFSKMGLAVSGLFLVAFLSLFAWVFLVASKNPADSGESAILMLPFAMPWIGWLPTSWLGPWTALAAVLLNAAILYAVFGGLRLRKNT